MARVIEDLAGDWRRLDDRIAVLSGEIEALARQDAGCERLMSVPGIGPIISSAMVAAVGTGEAFSKGRDFAAWLGLVPKQMSTGDRTILGKISKRGNSGGRRGRGLYLCRQRNFRGKTCWRATSFEQVGGLSAGPFSGSGGARRTRCLRALRWPCQFDRFRNCFAGLAGSPEASFVNRMASPRWSKIMPSSKNPTCRPG